jgi:hypothetical protein
VKVRYLKQRASRASSPGAAASFVPPFRLAAVAIGVAPKARSLERRRLVVSVTLAFVALGWLFFKIAERM